MDLPTGITQKDLVRYVKLNSQATKTKKLRDVLNDKIKKAFSTIDLEIGKAYLFGNVEIKMGRQMRFDAAAFAKAHPVEKFPQFYTLQLDTAKIPAAAMTDKFKTPVAVLGVSEVEVQQASIDIDTPTQVTAA